jgi:hypothetical protein
MPKPRMVSDLKREADEMVANGEMPPFEDVLKALVDARRVYRAQLKFMRLKKAKVVQ